MKKKILSLMLMVSLAASLAACGQDSGKNSNSTDLSKTETEASPGQTGEKRRPVYGSADYTRINRRWMSTVKLICCCSTD